MRIGMSDLVVKPIGIGTWQWGDARYWEFGVNYDANDLARAFDMALDMGITLFDTAEIYGNGESERLLAQQVKRTKSNIVVASKYMPWPSRVSGRAVAKAVEGSCRRLEVDTIDLYQVHWPFSLLRQPALLRTLALQVDKGCIRWVGVSNYGARRLRRAYKILAQYGVPLVSNQVQYSLLHRAPEVNGVLDTCNQLGITLIAYSPLAQGLLTGKYGPNAQVSGARRLSPAFRRKNRCEVEPVVSLLRQIGAKYKRSPAQVALNWVIRHRNVLAIPGAKNSSQVRMNAEAHGWEMAREDASLLDAATLKWQRRGWLERLL